MIGYPNGQYRLGWVQPEKLRRSIPAMLYLRLMFNTTTPHTFYALGVPCTPLTIAIPSSSIIPSYYNHLDDNAQRTQRPRRFLSLPRRPELC